MGDDEEVARAIWSLLASREYGASLDQHSDDFRALCRTLEFFVPAVLSEVYDFWRGESLDAFRIALARKSGPSSAELLGLCLLISDQSWTPFEFLVGITPTGKTIETLTLRVGEPGSGKGGLLRMPWGSPGVDRFASHLLERRADIAWVFEAQLEAGEFTGPPE